MKGANAKQNVRIIGVLVEQIKKYAIQSAIIV